MASASRALLSRLFSPLPAASRHLLHPAAAAGVLLPAALWSAPADAALASRRLARCFATQPATSSLRDSSPHWSNRPPKEAILLDGCDFEHWLVIMDPPPGNAGNPDITRDEIIDSYIKTLAQVVGSEQEARMKIYSVSTRHYFAFGALVSEELSYKLKELPKVRWVLPDSYLDVRNKDYGAEPFINGKAVPYDPKYHEEWVRNSTGANIRSRRTDRSRNFDRRENMQNFQNRDAPPPGQGFNFNGPPPPGPNQMPPRDAPPMHHAQGNMPPPPPSNAGPPPTYTHQAPNPQAGYTPGPPPNYQQSGAPGYQGPPPNYQQSGAPGYRGGNQGYQGNPGGNMQGGPGPAYQSNSPGYQGGGPGYQAGNPPYQGDGGPSYGGGGAPGYQGQGGNQNYQQGDNNYYEGGDTPGRSYQ